MEQQLARMRKKWRTNLIGDSPNLSQPEINKFVDNLSTDADELLNHLNKREDRTRLWKRIPSDTNSADVTTQFENLAIVTRAYGTTGTSVNNNEKILKQIVLGLDFLTASGKYDGNKYFGNWWDWQIGTPQQFTMILMIICDDIEQVKLDKYVDIMLKYISNPYLQLISKGQEHPSDISFSTLKSSGANRTDMAISYLGLGLLKNNNSVNTNCEMIQTAVHSIEEVVKTVRKNDGFYPDGSFIQHNYTPYTGHYGNYFIKAVGDILSIVDHTRWQLDEDKLNEYITNIQNAFLPIVANGEPIGCVNGRSISRNPSDKMKGPVTKTMYNLLINSEFANAKQKRELQRAAKYWIVQNPDYYYENTRFFNDLLFAMKVLADKSLDTSTKPVLGSHVYGAMDRFVYSDPEFQLGISMYSNRMSAFEAGNKENLKGWHLSDGMVYLYNSDQQFGDAYWPTVDWYRLPGTTVDTVALHKERTSFRTFTSSESYVGGVAYKQDAFLSMQLNKKGFYNNGHETEMNLRAKKSWFIIDGKIISLGTDINGTTNSSIETIIENRLLDPKSVYTFIDKQCKDVSTKVNLAMKEYDWLLLKSTKENQSIGYVILDKQIVQTKREERAGTYTDINEVYSNNTVYKGTYHNIIINHGKDVNNAQYAYMTYPNATESKLKTISKEAPYKIIANNSEVQAVKDKSSQTLGATIWNKIGGIIEGIQVNKAATLLFKQTSNNQVTLSISNPTHTSERIEVKLPQEITKVVAQDEGMLIKDKYTVVVDTAGGLGKSFTITANVAGEKMK